MIEPAKISEISYHFNIIDQSSTYPGPPCVSGCPILTTGLAVESLVAHAP